MNWQLVGISSVCVALVLVAGGVVHAQERDLLQEWMNYADYLKTFYQGQIQKLESANKELVQENDYLLGELGLLERDLAIEVGYANPVINGLIYGDITYYVHPVPPYSSYNVSNFDDYLDGRQLGGVLTRVYDESEADFSILWVKDYGPEYLGVAYGGNTATIGLGSSECGEWQPFDDWSITTTAWHEIGHVLGYDHSTDENNIMYPDGYAKLSYDIDIDEVLPGKWYISIPFCNGGNQYFDIETSDEIGFDVAVITPDTDPAEFVDYGTGEYYPDCSEWYGDKWNGSYWISYSDTCNIPFGSQLLISNPNDHPIEITGYIQDLNEHPDINMEWDDNFYYYDDAYLNYVHTLFG